MSYGYNSSMFSMHSSESIRFEYKMLNQYQDDIDKYYPMCIDFVNRDNNVKHTVLTMKQCYFIFSLLGPGYQFKTNPFREYK